MGSDPGRSEQPLLRLPHEKGCDDDSDDDKGRYPVRKPAGEKERAVNEKPHDGCNGGRWLLRCPAGDLGRH